MDVFALLKKRFDKGFLCINIFHHCEFSWLLFLIFLFKDTRGERQNLTCFLIFSENYNFFFTYFIIKIKNAIVRIKVKSPE